MILDAKLQLNLGGERLLATNQLDRVSRNDVLKRKQDKRYAQKNRDELEHTLEDVLSHTKNSPTVDTPKRDVNR